MFIEQVPEVDGHNVHPGEESEEDVLDKVAQDGAGQSLHLVALSF